MRENIDDRIQWVLAQHLGLPPNFKFDEDMSFVDDLGADSLDCVELRMAVEEEFEVDISDQDADDIVTIADLRRFVSSETV